ncbi:TrkA C-terminal domain-containing protein [Clostridium sp. DJ247]|uniref:TrkA C-terminal domain-containing protein n=1 Tax=Clostridium sp. DJ247 TaxID=2726188 RepID=UPI00162798A4|nr:TrkA C-terminal domain-containing protein [Clostridium sp. DJ247]MBC2581008.1 GntR family transcriptional regulator [Clostridium sp. DJ247]
MSNETITKPVYQQIAIDIANRIISGALPVGTKLHGRSTLASHYNVSPETIRRSVILLNDMGIVEVSKGSGIVVKSVDKCINFIDKFKDLDSISSLKKEISDLVTERRNIENKLELAIDKLKDYSNRFNSTNPFVPFEFQIVKGSSLIGKTTSEVKFWQNTGATIIAIRRNNQLVLSPGPYAVFNENDVFIAIGDENAYLRIKKFMQE